MTLDPKKEGGGGGAPLAVLTGLKDLWSPLSSLSNSEMEAASADMEAGPDLEWDTCSDVLFSSLPGSEASELSGMT